MNENPRVEMAIPPVRRRSLLTASGSILFGITETTAMTSTPFAASSTTPAALSGTCDCHVHVFAPDPFPYAAGRNYTPGPASVGDLRTFLASLGMERVVLVQPSVYGADNACLLNALEQLGPRVARGIAVIDPQRTTDAELNRMHSAGVRGVRVNLEVRGEDSGRTAGEAVRAAAIRVASRGWALQVYADMRVIGAVSDQLAALQIPVILDHFAGAKAERGPDQPGMAQVLNLLQTGNAYVKLSAPYRASSDGPSYANLAPIAQAFFAANPERLIWASDWPHTGGARSRNPGSVEVVEPFQAVDDRGALDAIVGWASDDRARRALLVDNPARLYGF
ncbi:hydrolase [Dankookia rubra]|uniref:Hydrolase n=1 Tax=Dankookia rubra TaxID=1442381 RepID=A0A4V3A9N0_9PROT|nr:amidohydrolase family protein [Dankookia rubra]TDH59925.1 hydrolase [Dankookia rubra]